MDQLLIKPLLSLWDVCELLSPKKINFLNGTEARVMNAHQEMLLKGGVGDPEQSIASTTNNHIKH